MFDGNLAHCVSVFLAPSGRAAEKYGAQEGTADAGPDFPGPLFSLLAVLERVWLQERQLSPGLHARHQIPAGPPFPPCQRLPGEGSPTLGAGGLWGAFSTWRKHPPTSHPALYSSLCGSPQRVWVSGKELASLQRWLPFSRGAKIG